MNDLAEHILLLSVDSPIVNYLLGEKGEDGEDLFEASKDISSGKTSLHLSKVVRRGIFKRMRSDVSLAIKSVDTIGYTDLAVRSLVQYHLTSLERMPLDSIGHCIYLDLVSSREKVSFVSRVVFFLLARGYTTGEIGSVTGENGSRSVSRACRELRKCLEKR